MKRLMKHRKPVYHTAACGCCEHMNDKNWKLDKQIAKEVLSAVRSYADEACKDYLLD